MPALPRHRSPPPPRASGPTLARRDFLKLTAASALGLWLARPELLAKPPPRLPFRFGLLTDPHYGNADPKGTRYYRDSLAKVREAVEQLRSARARFVGVLGDLIRDTEPGMPEDRVLADLDAIEREIQRFGGATYHVLGNHEMDNLSKAQVLAHVTNTGIPADRSYYAFTAGALRFLVLDTDYLRDGRAYDHGNYDWRVYHLPPPELEWLRAELAAAADPVIVFAHQRLDGEDDPSRDNRAEVRALLEGAGKVLAVFQGHEHKGGHSLIHDIHYYTLRGMIEGPGLDNSAYAVVDVHPDLRITVTGYRNAVSMELPRPAVPTRSRHWWKLW
jgi:hypothetical protein